MCLTFVRSCLTVAAQFDEEEPTKALLKNVAIRLTSAAILNSMIEQARMIVLKAVASATKTTVPAATEASVSSMLTGGSQNPASASGAPASVGSKLTGFRSALTLNASAAKEESPSPSLLKARSSALRLSSVLHHKTESPTASLGIRKIRSVKWDTPMHPPKLGGALAPSPKKPRKAINAARLKSFKSFGRPHAGDFGSGPRNATFAEFDRHQVWDRHGRLAHHPMPMQNNSNNDLMGMTDVADKNATFDLGRTRSVDTSRIKLPRTTTALEMFVLKKSTSGGKSMS